MTLKKCPCGEVLSALIVFCQPGDKLGTACGDGPCCGEWIVEFRNQYETDPAKILETAIKAWNAAPREGA